MSIASNCGSCMAGDHTRHDRDHGIREGVIGGTYCDCSGDCAERAEARGEELRALLTAPEATDPTPDEPVVHLDAETRVPVGVSKACPSTVVAHLGAVHPSGAVLRCGLLDDGHRRHVFHIEWTDPTDTPPSLGDRMKAANKPTRRPR